MRQVLLTLGVSLHGHNHHPPSCGFGRGGNGQRHRVDDGVRPRCADPRMPRRTRCRPGLGLRRTRSRTLRRRRPPHRPPHVPVRSGNTRMAAASQVRCARASHRRCRRPSRGCCCQLVPQGPHGVFSRVRSVQRLNTVGGQPPGFGCHRGTLGRRVRMAYRADYVLHTREAPARQAGSSTAGARCEHRTRQCTRVGRRDTRRGQRVRARARRVPELAWRHGRAAGAGAARGTRLRHGAHLAGLPAGVQSRPAAHPSCATVGGS